MKMLIAISQRNDKNKHGEYIDNLENSYVNYLEKFGVKLIVIPNLTKDVDSYFKEFPILGVILSGGNDINPRLYGELLKEGLSVSDERDETEKKILEVAIKKKLPVLGICRGMQFINVFFKGKLIMNIKEETGTKIEHVSANHKIIILNKELQKVLGKKTHVNSYHNQGIDSNRLSPELRTFAQSSDGIIEGVNHASLPIAGVQWHPERKSPDEEINNKIIKAFIEKELFWKK